MKLYIGIGIIIFLLIPLGIDQIFMNRFVTNWDMGHWSGFLGSYLGGGIGALITLAGVWWQMKRSEKEKNIENLLGILNHIEYILEKNLEGDNSEKKTFYVFSYNNISQTPSILENKYFFEFDQNFLNISMNNVYRLKFGKQVYELNDKILNFNKYYAYLANNSLEKKALFTKLNNEKGIEIYVHILEILSQLIRNISLYPEPNIAVTIEYLRDHISEAPIEMKSEINEIVKNINFNENQDKIKKILKDIVKAIRLTTERIQSKLKVESTIFSELLNFRVAEDEILRKDAYDLSEDMKKILEEISKEKKKIKG